jgi:hypothetical protein
LEAKNNAIEVFVPTPEPPLQGYDFSIFYKRLAETCRNNFVITSLNLVLITVTFTNNDDDNANTSNYLDLQEFYAAFGMLPNLAALCPSAYSNYTIDDDMQRLDILGLAALLQANKDLPDPRLHSLDIDEDYSASHGDWSNGVPELAKSLSNHPTLSKICLTNFGESTLTKESQI